MQKGNFAGLQVHGKRGKSTHASPTPHHTLLEELSARFIAQSLSALLFPLDRPPRAFLFSPLPSLLSTQKGVQATTTATTTKTSLKKWIRAASNFIALIPSRLICHMGANFFGVEFWRTVSKFRKRKRKLLSCVPVLDKTWIRHFHTSSLATTAKKCTKKRDARASYYFANLNLLLFCRSRCRRRHRCLTSLKRREIEEREVSGKLPTYPSPKLTLTLTSYLGQKDDLGEE